MDKEDGMYKFLFDRGCHLNGFKPSGGLFCNTSKDLVRSTFDVLKDHYVISYFPIYDKNGSFENREMKDEWGKLTTFKLCEDK